MADWIDSLANDWGHWMRKAAAKDASIHGTLGRIIEEGADGASIRSYGDGVPFTEFPLDVNRFHRAWRQLEPHLMNIIFVDYRIRGPLQKKLKVMRMKKTKYYRTRRLALDKIARTMAMAA